MDGYGVSDDARGLLDWTWAASRLETTRNYWLATVTPTGQPHAMPVWGVWLADPDEFIFCCDPNAKKARNLRENPHAVVTVDDTVEVVVVEGIATETRTTAIPDVVRTYARKYHSENRDDGPSEADLVAFLADTCAFRIKPSKAFGIIERPDEFGTRATRWVWR